MARPVTLETFRELFEVEYNCLIFDVIEGDMEKREAWHNRKKSVSDRRATRSTRLKGGRLLHLLDFDNYK